MSEVNEADVGAVLDELVNQFTDPMAFFRELVQNAIDAGSREVDIRIEHEAGDDGPGLITAYIDDFGSGMTREIIEGKLTRLFSSTKDDDYTKIGRFGIGFVSVFAVDPVIVVVDTARAGESWRVIFHPDRTWDLIRLDTPGEGTQIRVVMSGSDDDAAAFGKRAVKVLKTWCKHVEVPIYFNGEDIREPFTVASPLVVEHDEEGTHVVAGYTAEGSAPYGYYNRGLTLSEGHDSRWAPMTFKIDSRYLEHTLTRDRVIEDKNFHKVVRLLTEIAENLLPEKLFDELEAAIESRNLERYRELLGVLARVQGSTRGFEKTNSRRVAMMSVAGEKITFGELEKAIRQEKLLLGSQSEHLADVLDEWTLVMPSPYVPTSAILQRLAGRAVRSVDDVFALPRPADMTLFPGGKGLVRELRLLFRESLETPPEIGFGRFDYPGSPIEELFAMAGDGWVPQRIGEVRPPSLRELGRSSLVIINASAPAFGDLLHLAEREPEWAALELFKLIVVPWGLGVDDEDRVARMAASRRLRRTEAA